jgi:uncharacterized membrane protein
MVILETLSQLGIDAAVFAPKIAVAVVLLLIGWIVGWVVSVVSRKVLDLVKIDSYVQHDGKNHFLLSKIIPIPLVWFVYLAFVQAAVQALGIASLVEVVGTIMNFIPGLVGAILVIVAGYAIGEYIRRQIEAVKVMYSDIVGRGVFFLTLYIAVATALPLVQIDATLINNILLVIIGSVGAGFAIAIGLGLKDEVASVAKTYRGKGK